ncbi:putative ASI3 putative integral membrane E3 ubiquitin ligase [Venustampulla echinocandica]|uniref:Putative ASI3 putative integral membrane E3 ubiquitin ligase n=1 Tax=Venustampulla echinocandica TaxID=2656787 RepID=A0A370T9M4_9HELO|nr:putative ASI3 putative integral membrane E3 ubiquitin ligase [Venustampulla echinocandica]RDL30355.1 putative ASI3 putative integral membrane E3 ubiquitin ligase [Venustampulla echinocandica]
MDAFHQTPRFDLGSWAANWTAFNATQYVPSARDLALAGPRMVMKLGSFLALPEAVDNIFGAQMGERIIPEATRGGAGAGIVEAVTTAAVSAREVAQSATEILVDVDDQTAGLASRFSLEGARSLGNIFGYVTSKWAILCFVMAIVLNRTQIYASTRRNLVLPWKVRLAVRMMPIVLLLVQCQTLLQSIQCQTSPDFALLRWGNASKSSELMFTQDGGLLHTMSSTLLFGATDEESCLAVNMIPPQYDAESSNLKSGQPRLVLTGSLSRLWPLFKIFSFSQIVESISCAVQGRQTAAETGMTIFEHSLAFAEAEAAVGNQLGFGSFGGSKTVTAWTNSTTEEAQKIAITRTMIMERVNTPPEVLLVAFFSSMNHLTNHIFAIFNIQGRMRLLNTGFWGLAFMSAISWGMWTFSMDDYPSQRLLRFPTVCIVGFIPHVLVLFGITVCLTIYGAALILSALAPPANGDGIAAENGIDDAPQTGSTFLRRLRNAHQNMQANVPFSNIRISMHMDFYTALLRAGFSVMTMASEAVYLNESRGVAIKERTWLEEERLQEIEALGAQWLGPSFALRDHESLGDGLSHGVGLVAATDQPMNLLRKSSSGYAREMTTKKKTGTKGHDRVIRDGVGATERSGRWIMALEFFWGINRLVLSWWASAALKFLAKAGFQTRPTILVWLARRSKPNSSEKAKRDSNDPDSLNFWLLSIDGELTLPKDENVDVEEEMRNRIRNSQGSSALTGAQETKLESTLYTWWLSGGWWGGDDSSGDFVPSENEIDDDTTSVVSFSTTGDDQEWESDNDGQRTPTQRSPQVSRESTPFNDTPLNTADLAQLLHPKTPEHRAEAQALAVHLSSPNIVTRSRYRAIAQRERAKVLTSTLHRPADFSASSTSGKLTPEEETELLEHLIITSRGLKASTSSQSHPAAWAKGASGMGEGGPQCVVCQSSPRSIIVWPCRCLSLCDDCRVTLAMNNFDKCVCCRRDVASFSRIFVP